MEEQEQIKEWFEKTYTTRSKSYLRPPEAYEVFLSLLDPEPGQKLLDVACGPGHLLLPARKYDLKLHGIDISETAIGLAKESLPEADLRAGNAESLPFSDGYFDNITCIGSLERIINMQRALKEQLRVAAPEARFCYMVRNSRRPTWQFKKNFGLINKTGHQGADGIESWTKRFQESGFIIDRVVPDQWPRKRFLRKINPWMDFGKVKSGILPLRFAYEFIFLMRKA